MNKVSIQLLRKSGKLWELKQARMVRWKGFCNQADLSRKGSEGLSATTPSVNFVTLAELATPNFILLYQE